MRRRTALLTLLITLLFACDATSPITESHSTPVPDLSSSPTGQVPTIATPSAVVSGRSAKGPLINATIELFEMDGAGYPLNDTPVAQTQSDGEGFWQVDLPGRTADLLVRTSGGRYVDEADSSLESRREIILGNDDFLLSVLPVDAEAVAVTILTHALIEKSRRETGQDNFIEVLTDNRTAFSSAVGLDVLTIMPSDPLAPLGSADENRYALHIGGIANAVNALSIALNEAVPNYSHIEMVMQDLIDCRFDGRGLAGRTLWPVGLTSPPTLSLNQEIIRFFNNNAAAYASVNLDQIEDAECAVVGGSIDSVPPIIQLNAAVELAASDSLGIVATELIRNQISTQWTISDDRAGLIEVQASWPARFALGDNVLAVTAIDLWGNRSTEMLAIRVSDQAPPSIATLPTLSFAATGDLTLVDLPRPDVTDNVSESNNLAVSNNAPESGFVPGITIITWQVIDQAGLQASAEQTIEITSLAPTLNNVPSQLLFDGVPIDLSVFFSDPDQTTLNFSLNGLPVGSGLVFDPVTGVLSGSALLVDTDASPLTVNVVASDGPNTVDFSFDLLIPAPNTPPEFSLGTTQITVDEDFTPLTLPINLVPPPVSEQGQNVFYSVELISGADQPLVSVELINQSLVITAVENANGTTLVRVTANDGQFVNAEFVVDLPIVVNPVNDAPFSLGVVQRDDLITGAVFSLNLNESVVDVDDEILQYAAQRLPDSFLLDSNGVLSAVPQPIDALAEPLEIIIEVQDAAGEVVLQAVRLNINDPDSDGDGVSDYQEQLTGLNPFSIDTDNDGFGDQLESILPLDASIQSVLYVRPDGDDAADGLSIATALATLTEAGLRMNQLAADRESVVLVAASNAPYVGAVQILESTAGRSVIGSVDFSNGRLVENYTLTPATRLRNESSRVVDIQSCGACALYFIAAEQGQGMRVSDSQLYAQGVQWRGLRSDVDGAGLSIESSLVTLANVVFANNLSASAGGAVALTQGSDLTVYDSQFNGNGAAEQGGVLFANDSSVVLNNALITANAAPDGVLVAARNSTVTLQSATVSYNHVTRFNAGELLTCQRITAGVTSSCALDERARFKNGVALLNRDASNRVVDLDRAAVRGTYNLLEPARAVDVGEVEATAPVVFGANFGLTAPAGSSLVRGIDSGDTAALVSLVEQYFAVDNDQFSDGAQLDLGYHQPQPLVAPPPDKPAAILADYFGAQYGPTVIDVTLGYNDPLLAPLGRGHQVMVRAVSLDPRVQVNGPAPLLEPNGFRLATDLGDGRYRIWLNSAWVTGRDQIELMVDNHADTLTVQPTCGIPLCGVGSIFTQGNDHQGVDPLNVGRTE